MNLTWNAPTFGTQTNVGPSACQRKEALMNRLKMEKQLAVITALVEGNSIRSTERMLNVHRAIPSPRSAYQGVVTQDAAPLILLAYMLRACYLSP